MNFLMMILACFWINADTEIVRGHFKSNGTYVSPYFRSKANSTTFDNLKPKNDSLYKNSTDNYMKKNRYKSDYNLDD